VSPFFFIPGGNHVRGGSIDGHEPEPRHLQAAAHVGIDARPSRSLRLIRLGRCLFRPHGDIASGLLHTCANHLARRMIVNDDPSTATRTYLKIV
jgi:hypothetical protein